MDNALEPIARYYTEKLREHGATPRGVDWNSPESQDLRFTELLRVLRGDRAATVLDYGCGYGALAARLRRDGYSGAYTGYDVAGEMVAAARASHAGLPDCRFTSDGSDLAPADYVVASGIFNVRLDAARDEWERYIAGTIEHMGTLARRGIAFNMLTSWADADRMRGDLYYGDPAAWLTHCLQRFGRHAALLHDYALYEFTILVRLERP